MIIKLTKYGDGDVNDAIKYVFQEKNNKGEIRDGIELVYGNTQELIAISNSTNFQKKVKKLRYFSGVISLAPGEKLNKDQIQFLVSEYGYALNNNGQTDIPFVIVKHIEGDKEHYHVIGLRYDMNTKSFCNPFKPKWERKWIPWAKSIEDRLGLKVVKRKRDWIEKSYYDMKLLCSRNPKLQSQMDLSLTTLEMAYLLENFDVKEVDDERLERILSKSNRQYIEYCPTTDPKKIKQLIQGEISRDRKHNERYRNNKNSNNSKYNIKHFECYPVLDNFDKGIKKEEVKMENIKNSKEELEAFKKEINLVAFWTSNGGKVLERSSQSSFRIGWNNEKFLVSKNNNGHWLFQGIDNEGKRGSIIDLCNLMGIKNLGDIRKKLRLYLDSSQKTEEITIQEERKEEVKAIDWKERGLRLLSLEEIPKFQDIWKERGIVPSELSVFLKNVYTDFKNNLCFPIYDSENKVIGYEIKGRKGFKMNLGSKQGLTLIGDNTTSNEKIIITESAFDALAYEQLRPHPKRFFDVLYASVSGQLTEKQMEQIKKLIEYKKVNGILKEVVLAFDNDEQGKNYSEKIRNYLKDLNIQIKEHYSTQKDWNEELKFKLKGENVKWQKEEEEKRHYQDMQNCFN